MPAGRRRRCRCSSPTTPTGSGAAWRLAAVTPLLLPADRPRRAIPGAAGELSFRLSETADRGLDELARRLGATRFAVVLAAFEALLFRLTGNRCFAVGTPAARRE